MLNRIRNRKARKILTEEIDNLEREYWICIQGGMKGDCILRQISLLEEIRDRLK